MMQSTVYHITFMQLFISFVFLDHSFFHLPALTKGSKVSTDTVYGVACFRQIDSKVIQEPTVLALLTSFHCIKTNSAIH